MNKENQKIDFVLLWVDGSDSVWCKSFLEYVPESKRNDDVGEIRYRDWGLLPYWFRGVEQFAPWVNKIHFITCGHYPDWLDLNHPKLNFVKHSDYMPSECLPTFNSNPIELNLHRIESLSEHFVLFNDDFFIIDKVQPKRFFHNSLPCDIAVLDVVASVTYAEKIAHILLNNVCLINQKFNKFEVLWSHKSKWFNSKYSIKDLLRNVALFPWPYFTGFLNPHFPNAYLKSTLREVWNCYGDRLMEASLEKFRSGNDISHWLFRYWQLVKGEFHPINVYRSSAYYPINEKTLPEIERVIVNQEKQIVVLNEEDKGISVPFEECQRRICSAFQRILPIKSSFEK